MKITNSSSVIKIIVLVSALLRLYALGRVPAGLSLSEVNYGLWLSKLLGEWVLNPLVIRLPFALVGILSVYLFYLLIRKFGGSEKVALLSSFLLATTPWHIQESRILSWQIFVSFTLLLSAFLFARFIKKHSRGLTRVLLIASIGVFLLSLFIFTPSVTEKVNVYRNISYPTAGAVSKIFSNKLIESYRLHLGNVLEGMDPGYYFFSSHPRERWGVEETQKMFIVFLLLVILGLFRLKKKAGLPILGICLLTLSVNSALLLQSSASYFPAVIIFCYLAALGMLALTKKRLIAFVLIVVLSYEFVLFEINYINGFSESLFSPRRAYYINVVQKIGELRQPGELVLVNDVLGDPEPYFRFYLRDRELAGYEFRDYIVWDEENLDKLFVDIQAGELLPSTPLGNVNSENLNVLYERKVPKLGGMILIYRYGK
jgi:hypothetical protein